MYLGELIQMEIPSNWNTLTQSKFFSDSVCQKQLHRFEGFLNLQADCKMMVENSNKMNKSTEYTTKNCNTYKKVIKNVLSFSRVGYKKTILINTRQPYIHDACGYSSERQKKIRMREVGFVYVCMHLCFECICVCTRVCVCAHTCVFACVWVCVHVHVCESMFECTTAHVHSCVPQLLICSQHLFNVVPSKRNTIKRIVEAKSGFVTV